jgi:hypothetical protein
MLLSQTSEDIVTLVHGFKSRSLPLSQWTHEAHILVALCYLQETPSLSETHARLGEDIRAYNLSVGTANSDTSGYHDTLTLFWLNVVYPFVTRDAGREAAAIYARMKETLLTQRTLPLAFYSRARLFSTAARHQWVEPNLLPLTMLSSLISGEANAHHALDDETFETTFASGAMSASLFTHEAHLRLAWIHIQKYGPEQAIDHVTRQIIDFVSRLGAADKYNHTLTVAAVRVVNHFMEKSNTGTFYELLLAFPRLKNNFKDLICQHYSKDVLSMERAKKEYVEPDLLAF